MKKVAAAILGLAMLLAFSAGNAFADSKLDGAVEGLMGTKYKTGGSTADGFDCSGFTSYVFNQFGLTLPRTSLAQSEVGESVDRKDLQAGDLVFFNTNGKGVSHVGIYLGGDRFVHASTSKGVIVSGLGEAYYAARYVGARRVMSADAYLDIAVDPAAPLAGAAAEQ